MKKVIICIFCIVLIICICLGFGYVRKVAVKEALVKEAIAKAEINHLTSVNEKYYFDEDKNITSKTYLISEKEIEIPILLYHEFYEEEPPRELYGLISTPKKFEEDMITIIKEGYTFVSLDRVIDYKNGLKGLPEKCVVLTFDDGYISNYALIYPILKKYSIPVTIFVIEDMVGNNNHFDWESAKEMNDSGLVSIYTHGHSHVDMTQLNINDFKEKTANNLKTMEEKLGKQEHIVYSYPLGFYNEETNKVLKELGVEFCMTTNLGLNKKENLTTGILNRDYVTYSFGERKIIRILKGK